MLHFSIGVIIAALVLLLDECLHIGHGSKHALEYHALFGLDVILRASLVGVKSGWKFVDGAEYLVFGVNHLLRFAIDCEVFERAATETSCTEAAESNDPHPAPTQIFSRIPGKHHFAAKRDTLQHGMHDIFDRCDDAYFPSRLA